MLRKILFNIFVVILNKKLDEDSNFRQQNFRMADVSNFKIN